MECKHGTHEPCDLCAEEDAEHDREMAIQARIDALLAGYREIAAATDAQMKDGDLAREIAARMLGQQGE